MLGSSGSRMLTLATTALSEGLCRDDRERGLRQVADVERDSVMSQMRGEVEGSCMTFGLRMKWGAD
jgi:hypothetical protein